MERQQPWIVCCAATRLRQDGSGMRAAFKAATDSKQVAVLAPTTILAFQHYETFRPLRRVSLKIDLLSRFRTA